jgi:hypothetical protein
MAEKESNVRSTNFLKEETRDAWDKWVMLAKMILARIPSGISESTHSAYHCTWKETM